MKALFLFCDMFCFFTQLIRAKSRTFLAIGMNVILKIGILIFYHETAFLSSVPSSFILFNWIELNLNSCGHNFRKWVWQEIILSLSLESDRWSFKPSPNCECFCSSFNAKLFKYRDEIPKYTFPWRDHIHLQSTFWAVKVRYHRDNPFQQKAMLLFSDILGAENEIHLTPNQVLTRGSGDVWLER